MLLAAWAFSMLDILEELCRKIRPYETAAGETNRVFSECVEWIAAASKQGLGKMIGAFRRAIEHSGGSAMTAPAASPGCWSPASCW